MKIIRLQGEDYTRYMKNFEGARHSIKKALWDQVQAPFRLMHPSGRFLGIVRTDPGEASPVESESESVVTSNDDVVSEERMFKQMDNQRRQKNSGNVLRAPSPRECKCAQWPGDEERERDSRGRPQSHHENCAFKKMYERQGGQIKHVFSGPVMEPQHHPGMKPKNHSNPTPQLMGRSKGATKVRDKDGKVPHPDRCPKCKDFTKSKKMEQDQHHPTCVFYKKFKAISLARHAAGMPALTPEPIKLKIMLYDLDSQEVVRPAEPDEVQVGRIKMRDDGIALVVVDGDSYLAMYEDGTALPPAGPDEQLPPEPGQQIEEEQQEPVDTSGSEVVETPAEA